VASPARKYFSTLSQKRYDFREKKKEKKKTGTEHKMCVLIFSATFARNVSHSKKK
jgi:hypothetical protein